MKKSNLTTITKGDKHALVFKRGGKQHLFTAGGKKRLPLGDGMVMVNGQVKLADGTLCYAVLEISEEDSGEHYGTGIMLPHDLGITFQNDPDFLKKLGRTKKDVYPYKYRYDGTVHCDDHHVGDDGWSY